MNKKNSIACCYFPTTAVFVDDHSEYLKNLTFRLPNDLLYKFYYDPVNLLNYFKEDYQPPAFIKKWLLNLKDTKVELGRTLEENDLTHAYIDVDVESIHQQIYAPERFDNISVLVVDYAMPQMTGIDLCEQLYTLPVKKIMMTGQAGYEMGVEALNSGVIDRYILKDSPEAFGKLNDAIAEMQQEYFKDLSATVIQNLGTSKRSCVTDPVFIDFFTKLREERNIIEYYLVNDSGCFLMLDVNGNLSWLVVKREAEMRRYYSSVRDNDGPEDMVQALKNREKLLFLFSKNDEYINRIEQWRPYLHPAKPLEGASHKFYYSIIEGPSVYEIDVTKIASYDDRLYAE
ncbi:MAG: response regulator transcription factor [Gammaproteobacteria bacterium]|nr:response regulator transcription factor [Gammaproteobacteria bacterium]